VRRWAKFEGSANGRVQVEVVEGGVKVTIA
jgi:hypothetical protein